MPFIDLEDSVTIAVIYRTPDSRLPTFLQKLEEILEDFLNPQRRVIIAGDFYINNDDQESTEYQSLLSSYGFEITQ